MGGKMDDDVQPDQVRGNLLQGSSDPSTEHVPSSFEERANSH